MAVVRPSRPTSRHGFEIAVICALTLEADAVEALFDIYWDDNGPPFDKAASDPNAYSTGAIGRHNVVLAHMPDMGKASAAVVASNCRTSFPNIKLALVVGVCGVAPFVFGPSKTEIVLGDVVISDGVIQYDFGRRLPDRFERKDTLLDSLGRPNLEIRGLLAKLKGLRGRKQLSSAITKYLGEIQQEPDLNAAYPGIVNDRLFEATYRHIGDQETCEQVGCNGSLVQRQRLQTSQEGLQPAVHFGLIASGDSVMKSGQDRDTIAAKEGVVAFEMEGAGVWDSLPSVVIKGACDYADSHKNKQWQHYAAATAAACMKAFLSQWVPSLCNEPQINGGGAVGLNEEIHQPCYYIQLAKNTRFTGRTAILDILEEKFFGKDQSQRVALVGLGGVGKTQIALRFAYQMKDKWPDYSIFWVPVLSDESAEQAFAEIAKKLDLQKSSEEEDVKELVCRHLNSDEAGKWLLIIDNADDTDLVFGSRNKPGLEEYFPQSESGKILLTTRSGQVAGEFAQSDVIDIEQMDEVEAMDLLQKFLKEQPQNEGLAAELLTHLTFLPLAITQAAAYLTQTKAPIQKYLGLLRGAEKDVPRVLGREFRDNTRYRGSRNAIGATWLVSFDRIKKSNKVADILLSFISCIEPKAIPQSMLPNAESEETEWAIGVLCSYSFLVRRGDGSMFDMHSLVHMATRGWVEKEGRRDQVADHAIGHLGNILPPDNRHLRREYLPHAMRLLYQSTEKRKDDTYRLYGKVGDCFNNERRPKEAARCYEEVYNWNKDRLSEKDKNRLVSEHKLASAYLDDRRTKDAIKMFEHVVAVKKEMLDEKNHSRLSSEHNLASAYLNDGRTKDAIGMLGRVAAIRRETLDEKDDSRLSSEHNLASAYLDDGQIQDAIKMFEHIVAIQKETLDEKDYSRLTSEHELARAYLDDGQIQDAIKMFEHIVAIQKDTLGEKDDSRLSSEHNLARAYLDNGQIEDAIKMFEHVVAIEKETLDEKDDSRLSSEHNLASAYLDDGQIQDAIKMFEHIVAIRKETLDEKDDSRLSSEHNLASAYLDDGQIEDAIKMFEHIVAIRKETLDEKDYSRLTSEHELARAYLYDGQIQDAIKMFEHVVAIRKETLDETDYSRLTSEHELASAYLDNGQIEDAIKMLEHVVTVESGTHAHDDPSRLLSVNLLRDAYKRLQASDENK